MRLDGDSGVCVGRRITPSAGAPEPAPSLPKGLAIFEDWVREDLRVGMWELEVVLGSPRCGNPPDLEQPADSIVLIVPEAAVVTCEMAMLHQLAASPVENAPPSDKICKHEAANGQPNQTAPILRNQCICGVTCQVDAEDY